MQYCSNCGTQLQEGMKFCQSCGKEVGSPAGQQDTQQRQQSEQGQQQQGQQQYHQQQHGYVPPTGHGTGWQADSRDVQENKTMAIIAYILFFVPLIAGVHKSSPFARYHTNQGTVLFVTAAIYGVAYGILTAILIFIPIIGWLLIWVLGLAGFGFLAFLIIGIVNAANGTMKPLPIIGGFTIIK